MPADQLVHETLADRVVIKDVALASELGVEDDLEQQVSKLFGHLVVVARLDGVEQLVDLFDRVPTQRPMVLFAVPRTSVRRAQGGHDLQELADGREFLGRRLGHGNLEGSGWWSVISDQ